MVHREWTINEKAGTARAWASSSVCCMPEAAFFLDSEMAAARFSFSDKGDDGEACTIGGVLFEEGGEAGGGV